MIIKEFIAENTTTLSREALMGLSGYHNSTCISIYIPTHRAGMETLNGQDSKNLKNQIHEIRLKLQDEGMIALKIEKLLNPLIDLVENSDFWRYQSEGLSIFLAEDLFEKYVSLINFKEFNYLSSEFYLIPLLQAFYIDQPDFNEVLNEKKEKFLIGYDKGKSSDDIREIVHASVTGRTDTIFMAKDSDVFGIYDPDNGETIIQEEHKTANVSLMNLAAKKTFEQGGLVYMLDRTSMPDGSADMNALFRY